MRGASQRGPSQQRGFFGLPIAASSWCELDASSLGPGVSLTISQVTLAAPLPTAPSKVRLFCNGVAICSLSQRMPNSKVQLSVASKISFECVGPDNSGGVHLIGYTYANVKRREPKDPEPEDKRTEDEWGELQRGRKRRIEELRREAAVAAAAPSTAPTRIPRLHFNPNVLVAEYVPKQSGISPMRAHLSLDEMVARREEIKQRQARESSGDGGEEEDDEMVLQGVLAELLSCSVNKLRVICKANGLDTLGKRAAMIERLIDHIASDLREARAERGEPSVARLELVGDE